MKDFMLLLFSVTGGLTVSGIVANLYRLLMKQPGPAAQKRPSILYCAVMVLAGPSVLIENATKSVRAKKCSRLAYFFAIALSSYWAFVIGLLTIQIGISI